MTRLKRQEALAPSPLSIEVEVGQSPLIPHGTGQDPPPIVAAPGARELSGVILVMSTSLSSTHPALISASSGACLRIAAHFHSTPVSVHFTGQETEADIVEGEPKA